MHTSVLRETVDVKIVEEEQSEIYTFSAKEIKIVKAAKDDNKEVVDEKILKMLED